MAVSAVSALADTVAPSYPGGVKACNEFIGKNMIYPAEARENFVEGDVTLTFMVKADGTLSDIKVKRMIDPDLEAEAIRIVKKMPKWVPGSEDGKAVDAPAEVTVQFVL